MGEVDEPAEHDKAENFVDESQHSWMSPLEQIAIIRTNGEKVPVTELAGKTVGLYFPDFLSEEFDAQLAEIYNELLERGEAFEIVVVTNCNNEGYFEEKDEGMPWRLGVPLEELNQRNPKKLFHIGYFPNLIVIGPDGQIIQPNEKAVKLIQKYGIRAYPFTYERLREIDTEENAKLRATKTLETLFHRDEFLIGYKPGHKQPQIRVPVSKLVGKTVALLFCSRFSSFFESTLTLLQAYDELKERGEAFEVVLMGEEDERNEEFLDSFEYLSGRHLPWLYFPEEISDLKLHFFDEEERYTKLVVFGPDGKFITYDGHYAVSLYGAKAYPFTDTHLASLERELDEIAKKSAKVIKPTWHQFPLVLTKLYDFCCLCALDGRGWCYYCGEEEDIYVHLTCASGNDPCNRFAVPLHGCKVPCDICNPFP